MPRGPYRRRARVPCRVPKRSAQCSSRSPTNGRARPNSPRSPGPAKGAAPCGLALRERGLAERRGTAATWATSGDVPLPSFAYNQTGSRSGQWGHSASRRPRASGWPGQARHPSGTRRVPGVPRSTDEETYPCSLSRPQPRRPPRRRARMVSWPGRRRSRGARNTTCRRKVARASLPPPQIRPASPSCER